MKLYFIEVEREEKEDERGEKKRKTPMSSSQNIWALNFIFQQYT